MGGTAEPIVLLYCIDNNFLKPAAVAIAAVLQSNPTSTFEVNIAAFGRDPVLSGAVFDPIASRFSNCRFVFHDLDEGLFAGLPVTTTITSATYARLVLARFLAADLERVLYFDADIIVCADLRPLWETPIDDVVLAAAPDHFNLDAHAIGFGQNEPYFNAGVLLFNLRRWRAENIERQVFERLADRSSALPWMDQDVLNVVLRARVRFLDITWNYQPRCADVPSDFLGLNPQEYRALRANPKVIHYTTSHKPWNASYRVHYSELFFAASRAAGLASSFRIPAVRGTGARVLQVKTWLRWHFPSLFRTIRRIVKPKDAGLMYRASAGH